MRVSVCLLLYPRRRRGLVARRAAGGARRGEVLGEGGYRRLGGAQLAGGGLAHGCWCLLRASRGGNSFVEAKLALGLLSCWVRRDARSRSWLVDARDRGCEALLRLFSARKSEQAARFGCRLRPAAAGQIAHTHRGAPTLLRTAFCLENDARLSRATLRQLILRGTRCARYNLRSEQHCH